MGYALMKLKPNAWLLAKLAAKLNQLSAEYGAATKASTAQLGLAFHGNRFRILHTIHGTSIWGGHQRLRGDWKSIARTQRGRKEV